MKLVTFDESGNTGPDLLNQQQPVFVLASSFISVDLAKSLLLYVKKEDENEVKFSNLKRNDDGLQKLYTFLEIAHRYKDKFKTSFYHKEYMVVTKIVDIIIESMAYDDGLDLYKDGANIAMSNMLFYCMPVFCDKNKVSEMYKYFISMVRNQDSNSISKFYEIISSLYDNCTDKDFKSSLAPIVASKNKIKAILEHVNSRTLDPAIPAFFNHCAQWGDAFNEEFDVLHDSSKSLYKEKETLELYMSKDIPHETIGHDRRKFGFPLKANGLIFGDSKNDPRLQVVDLIASASSHWATQKVLNKTDNELWKMIDSLKITDFCLDAIWPSTDITPEELGTEGNYGINAVDHITSTIHDIKKPNK